jgi:hypothetical protein
MMSTAVANLTNIIVLSSIKLQSILTRGRKSSRHYTTFREIHAFDSELPISTMPAFSAITTYSPSAETPASGRDFILTCVI